MALPAFIIPLGSLIGRSTLQKLGVHALSSAFKTGGLKGFLTTLGNFIWGAIVKSWSFVQGLQWVLQGVRFLYTFNWNMSDESIDQRINGILLGLSGMAGGVVGQTLGWVLCGAAGLSAVVKINPAALAFTMDDFTDEAIDEVAGAWVNLVKATAMKAAEGIFYWGFKNIRSFLKQNALMRTVFGAERMDNWGKKGGPVVSIAKGVEDAIESIPNQFVRNFVEEAYEEFWESCAEAFFVLASGMDSFYSQAKLSQSQQTLGRDRVVEITPNRDQPTERIVLAGPTELLKTNIIQTITNEQLMRNRDVGVVFATPADDNIIRRPPPSTRWEARIQYYNLPLGKPPIPRGTNKVSACYKIPNFNPMYLTDYERIKRLASVTGDNGYMQGRFRMSAHLSNNGQMQVYTDSEASGEELINNLLQLSDGVSVRRFAPGTIKAGGNIPASEIDRNSVKMYPYSILFIRHKRSTDPNVGKIREFDGERVQYLKQRFFIWPDLKPTNWDSKITEMMAD